MRSPRFIGLGLWSVLVPLLGSLGCTISITPAWHMPAATPAPGSYPYPVTPMPGSGAGIANPNMPPGAMPPGAMPPGAMSPPGAIMPQPLPARGAGDAYSLMQERLLSAEDSRQALANRVQVLQEALRAKDQDVLQTSHEVQESTKQMRRTREELLRLKQELDDSRAKSQATYREYKDTLGAFLKALEENVDPGKTTPSYRGIVAEPPTR
jgi:hypothetical protein